MSEARHQTSDIRLPSSDFKPYLCKSFTFFQKQIFHQTVKAYYQMMMRTQVITLILGFIFFITLANAQSVPPIQKSAVISNLAFIDYQRTFPRPNDALKRKEDTLKKQFAEKKLVWPAKYIYIRSFKFDSQLEVWVKDELKKPFRLFNAYNVCAMAGSLGPKRMEGDYQVPEGFYLIKEFNPKSSYYLSLGINYPNVSDRILSDSVSPGGDIYIHGSCVTTGCIPMTDGKIEEIYIIAAYAKSLGQDYIPVHIFPIRFNVQRSVDYLDKMAKDDIRLKKFDSRMEDAFDYFEKYHRLPVIMINEAGEYIVDGALPRKRIISKEEITVKKVPVQHRFRNVGDLVEAVHQWPQFPGGTGAFTKYLDDLGNDMASYLPKGTQKAYIKVEYIIDKDGVPTNFKLARSINEDFDDELISRMENMGTWQPAILHDKPVAKKMVQTFTVEKL